MAAPATHVLTGLAVLIGAAAPKRTLRVGHAVAASVLALGPDLLLLLALAAGVNRFTGEQLSHSALLPVSVAAILLRTARGPAAHAPGGRLGLVAWLPADTAIGALLLAVSIWLSHAVLDTLSADLAAPPGASVLWPIRREPLQLAAWFPVKVIETDNVEAFMDSVLSRAFLRQSAQEALAVAPLLIAAWLLRAHRKRRDQGPS